ncbi:MAG TPA: hypothetical protein VFN22_08270 [Gemmatimonadales bacterium]|nr:hypothetical protein [Gemmatimonadales bacterium]
MSLLGIALLVALCIPIIGLLLDSPIARAVAQRLERGTPTPSSGDQDLQRRFDLLEGDVEVLQHAVQELREENQFLQQLLEESRQRPALPSDGG